MIEDEEQLFLERRRRRNTAIGVALGGLAVLFYLVTVGRMAG
ncbi:MAG: hypothetical protein NZM40_10530 [Sphingomonadaceae bacterium]|nr:hypothetical protein [Thermaurantiacus sp.]MCS6987840.1 hypothetical protein [Sphingomonadaceae bacterium]MDW8414940.1 hypothetical protein [Thermaurantiacus sp.]